MKTQSIPSHLPEPPPATHHDFELDLLDGERVVGWLRPDAIGFTGFANASEASHAAWVAYRTLSRRLARRDGRRPVPIDMEPLRLVAEGDGYLIVSSRDRVARLVEPATNEPADNGFGFELRLDAPLDEVAVRGKAYLIYRTLRRSGLRWSMWRPIPARTVPQARAAVITTRADEEVGVEHQRRLRPIAVLAVLAAVLMVAGMLPGTVAATVALVGLVGLMAIRLTLVPSGGPMRRVNPDHRANAYDPT